MAEENPQDVNPATDPQVEDAPSTVVPVAEIDTAPAPVAPATNPEVPAIPVPRVEIPPPPPDAAFRAEQAQQENRWIQAAAANPENIQMNGSVVIDLGDGRQETINRDGSYAISGGDGTFRFDAAGQPTSYTTPTFNGISFTSTTDGVQYTNISQGPLTQSIITKDGEPISTTTSLDTGFAKVTSIDTVGGQPVAITEVSIGNGFIVKSASTILTDGETQLDPGARLAQALGDANAGVVPEGTQVELVDLAALRGIRRTADGDFVADPTLLRDYNAETEKLREELIAAKQQTSAGIPLSDTQIAALEEQAQVTAAAEQALFEAEQTLAELDPTVVAAGEDPQVDTFVDPVADPLPSLDTVEVAAENVDTAADPEVPPGISTEQIQSNQEAFAEAQATGRENSDGSVTTVDDTGVQTTLFPDGAKTVSDASGTTTFNAEGEATSHTSPTVNGFSETTFADGSQTLNKTIPLADTPDAGALTIRQDITPDGTVVSETTAVDLGLVQAEQTVTNGEIVGQQFTDNLEGEQEILAAERDVQQTEQQLATAEAELAGTQQEIVDTVRAGGEPTTAQLETLAAQESEVAALEEQLATDEQALVSTQEAQGVDPDPTTLTAAEQAADPEVSAFEEQQASEVVPLADIETEADTELTPEEEAADPEVVEPLEEFVAEADIETQAATELTEEQTAADPEITAVESGIPLGEIDSEPLTVSQDDPQAPRAEEFSLSAADIDGGEDLDQDPGPGYGDVDEPLDPDVLDRANEVEVDPYEDVLGRDLTEEEIAAEDNPIDYSNEVEVDPYEDVLGRDLTEEEIAAEDNPIDYSNEVEVDPYEDVLGRDLTEEEIQAEDNPIDYDLEEEIDPYNAISDRDAEELSPEEIQAEDNPIDYNTEDEIDPYNAISDRDAEEGLTDEEIDAARADQQVEFGPDGLTTLSSAEAARQKSTLDRARAQYILQQQRKQANDGDWRVRLRLAPNAEYLYKSDQPGILQPLAVTDGVVFPYTPQITTAYKATYSPYDLTHSNYRGFFYQSSQVDDIQLNATFTAQDTAEANYLLAVIHFFRSVTKMFYGGQDASQRGAPPPLVFLQGFGEYQFNLNPCVVASFNYVLPADVDYIRAGSPNINGTNLLQRRDRQDLPTNPFSSAWTRINNVLKPQGIKKGAVSSPPPPPTLGTNRPTYVPTKMDISLVLHPMQSREQVSKQFSLKQYANGDLLKGGFW